MAGFGLPPLRLPGEDEEEDEIDYEAAFRDLDAAPPVQPKPAPPQLPMPPPAQPGVSRTRGVDSAIEADRRRSFGGDMVSNAAAIFRPGREISWSKGASAAQEDAMRDAARKADERNDPKSSRNVFYRSLLSRAHPDVWNQLPPDRRESLTADQINDFAPWMKELSRTEQAKLKMLSDAEAAKAKEAQRLKERGEDQRLAREKEDRGYSNARSVAEIAAGRKRQEIEDAEKAKAEQAAKDEIYKWNSRVEGKGIRKGMQAFASIDSIAQKYGGIEKIPGVGIGKGALPNAALPPDAQMFRQEGSSVISQYRNKLFGSSLSDNERDDFKRIANLGGDATVSEVANALKILRRGLIADAEESLAGAPEHVKEQIFRDLGVPYKARTPGSFDLGSGSGDPAKDEAAFKWASEHPNDPRAQEILKSFGVIP